MKLSDLNLQDFGSVRAMAGMVFVGQGQLLLALFPEDHGDLSCNQVNAAGAHEALLTGADGSVDEIHALNLSLEEWQVLLRQTDLMETEVLAKGDDGAPVKAILRKSQRQVDQGVNWRVFKRDGYACRYCAADDVPLTVDHLVLWEVGGPSTEANLVSSCRKCNKTRGNKSYDDWLIHPHYLKVSKNLSEGARQANIALAGTLASIPRTLHQRSR